MSVKKMVGVKKDGECKKRRSECECDCGCCVMKSRSLNTLLLLQNRTVNAAIIIPLHNTPIAFHLHYNRLSQVRGEIVDVLIDRNRNRDWGECECERV